MASGTTEITIDRDPDTVWKVVGDFGGLAAWLPGIESCEVNGDDRVLSMMGMTITETLRSRDDAARALTYGISGGPLALEQHEATITVHPSDGGSRVTWEVTVVPDTLLDMFVQTYAQGLAALNDHMRR
jgi:carbon monoxide dehydrogenase subunit G